MSARADTSSHTSTLLRIGGQVQGVGFRPFVYRIATASGLTGWVENQGSEVLLLLQGESQTIQSALHTLLHSHPPLARPQLLEQRQLNTSAYDHFRIRQSSTSTQLSPHIPPDYFVCDECLAEFNNPANRRYHYPFINCTQCGPRYTLIKRLPYDRPNTTLAGFPLCPPCQAEYSDPLNRRFHAEPIACPDCGPRLCFRQNTTHSNDNEEAISAALDVLHRGEILAVKGVGGYHLMCDARNEQAVQRLRTKKNRPHKPLAVMFPPRGADGLAALKHELAPTVREATLLGAPLRPIVLCKKRPTTGLTLSIAPGLAEIGAMLPYSPLHHLLCDAFSGPLVTTSGNISGEPVLTDEQEAERRLSGIADAFLHHNRPIQRPADDPLYRTLAGRPRPLRLGRGNAPLEHSLPFTLDKAVLAVGGEMKNAVGLAWENRMVLSPHIGELHSRRGLQVFQQVITELQRLYAVEATMVLHDAHPNYHSSRWARECGLPTIAIPHHYAHASALYAEHCKEYQQEAWLVATWDGVGYGDDGTLWGGETLLGRPGDWRRFARFRPFRLPGGDKAAREPWRSALALCLESGITWTEAPEEASLLSEAWQRGLNTAETTAVGRLFDAAAALLGLCQQASYEGQAPMMLEARAGHPQGHVTLPLQKDPHGIWQSDWRPLLPVLLDTTAAVDERAAIFHHSLAQTLCQQALKARETHGISTIGVTGGVFQNRYLTDLVTELLSSHGLTVRHTTQLPCNDAALAWGQIIEAAHTL